MFRLIAVITFLFFAIITLNAQNGSGSVSGLVLDKDSNQPLPGANILLEGTNTGAASGGDGSFTINNLPAGRYKLIVMYIGYNTKKIADVIVRPSRTSRFTIKLTAEVLQTDEVTVMSDYFNDDASQITGATNYSYEEIRRAPGSAGDVSRVLFSLPSIAKVNDQRNSLVVRGGAPSENAFFIDNIEIPNINHFPVQGTSGGPIGLINVDFIEDVDFSAGGFGPQYGDKLSSVIDMNFREGNYNNMDVQLDLSMAGMGAVAEGPARANGNYMISLRRSYVDLLIDMFDTGTGVAPRYGDYQGKYTFKTNKQNKFSVVAIWSDDHMRNNKEDAIENDMLYYGNQDIVVGTTGLNWLALWDKNGYSETSIAYTSSDFKEDFYEPATSDLLVNNRSFEESINLRNTNTWKINNFFSFIFGFDLKYMSADYNNLYGAATDPLGQLVPETKITNDIYGNKLGAFVNYKIKPASFLEMNLGLRSDYFSFNKNWYISPRFSVKSKLTDAMSLYGSVGVYTQNLPLVLLTQDDKFTKLNDPKAIHYVAGLSYMLNESTRLTIEGYLKNYTDMPVNPDQPELFLTDEIFYNKAFYTNHADITNDGKAKSYGVELILQKKLASDFYGLISGSLFRSKYSGADGIERNRVFDNKYVFSMEGGYKPSDNWDLSLRWIYAGGVPYTPFDIAASTNANSGIMDKNRVNMERYPDYHSLNVRVDRRFNFSGSSLVVYISVWNAYGRKNVASYFWNKSKNKKDTEYQWGMLPIFGAEYEL